MPVNPFGSKKAVISKSPGEGNKAKFSNGKAEAEIIAWEVWNSRYKRQYSPQSKIYGDETTLVVRTRNPLAKELESDDGLKWEGYTYSVQEIHSVKTFYNFNSEDYEIKLR